MAARIGCSFLKTPFSYLGVTVGGNMCRVASWTDIIRKVTAKLSDWKAKTFSIGGRLTLVKAMLGALPTYFMSIYKAAMTEKKMTWVSWKQVMAKKDCGGLGVSSLFALNRALLFKWIWRFCSKPDVLWANVIRAIHGYFRLRLPSRILSLTGSAWCAILLAIRDLRNKGVQLLECCSRRIGSGATTLFWSDVWLTPKPFSVTFCSGNDKMVSVRAKFDHEDWFTSFRRPPRGGAESAQWKQLFALLDTVVLSSASDRWHWSLDASGDFLVSSARNHIDNIILPNIPCQSRWNKLVPIKVNVFIWRMCGVSKDLARLVCCWWKVPDADFGFFEDWSDWFISVRNKAKDCLEACFFTCWWFIWRYRNSLLFSSRPFFKPLLPTRFVWVSSRSRQSNLNWVGWLQDPILTIASIKTTIKQMNRHGRGLQLGNPIDTKFLDLINKH
ncbi:hypothetical protein LXL04_010345 [Taraxacum kok-saghyz]